MIQLKTGWKVEAYAVHPEYPRPRMVRDNYINLNGEWECCINQSPQTALYEDAILVPFSPEAFLSGVQKQVLPTDFLHYRKIFSLPTDFIKDRVILHFGAVDQECSVYLNGQAIGEHVGGYLAFSFDITDALRAGENVLEVCVKDATEAKPHARGKQKLVKKGKYASIFYTPQSGIWKDVWLESVYAAYIEDIKITPCYDESGILLCIKTRGEANRATICILDKKEAILELEISCNEDVFVPVKACKSWSPDHPYLYDIVIAYEKDVVSSYFGIRKWHMERDSKGILRFFLNNKPFFFNGVLDQGYWPESLMTPPSDEALRYDIEKLKELGFNTIRKHVKIESDRFYYHCDKIGMAVWQDMPNGGGDYNMIFVTYLTNAFDWFARGVKDSHYRLFKRQDKEGREQYYKDLKGMIEQLYHYPAIATWVPFNEGWGQFDAHKATALIKECDSTRFVNEACGWFDQKGGDMYSIHNYSKGLNIKAQKDRVVALTEFGGYSYAMQGHVACKKEFGYQSFSSKEELTVAYKRLWEEEIFPNLAEGLSAAIYTQTSDIEEEVNGILTYDREEVKLIEKEVKTINQALYEIWEELV